METIVDIPLKNGEHYLIPFIPIQSEPSDEEMSQAATLIAKNLLTWELILGIDKCIIYYNIEHSPSDLVLDIGFSELSELMEYLNQYAPSGYRFDLPTEVDWIQSYNNGCIINKVNFPFLVELTSTWDHEHCTPANSAGSGISYFALGLDDKSQEGYWKRSVSEVYGKWDCPIGIRFILKKYTPLTSSERTRLAFIVANEALKLLKKGIR